MPSNSAHAPACRHFFLDAALLMHGHPQEHLLQAWAGILQQQQDDNGEQRPAPLAELQRRAMELWTVCASAALIACHNTWGQLYSRCMLVGCVIPVAAVFASSETVIIVCKSFFSPRQGSERQQRLVCAGFKPMTALWRWRRRCGMTSSVPAGP